MAEFAVVNRQKLEKRKKILTALYVVTSVVLAIALVSYAVVGYFDEVDYFKEFLDNVLLNLTLTLGISIMFSMAAYFTVIKKGTRKKSLFVVSLAVPLALLIVFIVMKFNIDGPHTYEAIGIMAMCLYIAAYLAEIIDTIVNGFRTKWLAITAMSLEMVGQIVLIVYNEVWYEYWYGFGYDWYDYNCCAFLIVICIVFSVVLLAVRILHYLLATQWYCDNCDSVCSYDMKFCKKCGSKNPTLK